MGCQRPRTSSSDPYDLGELWKPLRDSIWTCCKDAPTAGLVLVSGHRDPGRQWDLRGSHGCRGRECDSRCKCHPATAVPAQWNGTEWVGGSKHQHRKAADMGGRDLWWLIQNHRRYGLVRTVPSENWHYERLNEPSVRILTYPGPTYDGQTPPPPPEVPDVNADEHRWLKESTENSRASLAVMERIEQRLTGVASKASAHRDPRNGKVWIIDADGRWHVPNRDALNVLIYTGLVAALPGGRIPDGDPSWLDSIPITAG